MSKILELKRGGLGFGIDRGGTFTDVFVVYPDGRERTFKLLSEDTGNYADAPTEAIRRILNEYTGQTVARGEKIPTDDIAWIRMGTTVATNALLERKGEKTALLITRGFKDLLYIDNQSRPKIFDFDIRVPPPLYEAVFEVDERVLLAEDPSDARGELRTMPLDGRRVTTASGQEVIVERPICANEINEVLAEARRQEIRSLAVLFLHSYIFPDHERFVQEAAGRIGGFINVSLSSAVIPMIKAVPRGFTTTADAYLTPVIQTYIDGFRAGFVNNLAGVELEFMQSDGGLCPVDSFFGSRAILSGPAGGVVGISLTAYSEDAPIIGFDMGGTSTDVSRYAGNFSHAIESVTAGVTIQAPQLEICTVAAGGGSRLFYNNGMFAVGPESAGSTPGPVCYRKPGGSLTVTDANLVLGRILPEHFPHIFGLTEDQPLDKTAAELAFEKLTAEINASLAADNRPPISIRAAALGFIEVANEAMCRPIRKLTEAKGFDTSAHVLACFGGAGGQHACSIARKLGMRRVKIHRYAGILSAYGLALADVVVEQQEPCIRTLALENYAEIEYRLDVLTEKCRVALVERHGFATAESTRFAFERILHARYARTDCVLMCSSSELDTSYIKHGKFLDAMRTLFVHKYRREFGFVIADRDICIDDLRVRGSAKRHIVPPPRLVVADTDSASLKLLQISKCTFTEGNDIDTKVFRWSDLPPGSRIDGPAIIIDPNCTIVVELNCEAYVDVNDNVELTLGPTGRPAINSVDVDPIQLSIFSHRFMSIAEQMGTALQRSAISTNIKERLDFSCALFDAGGGLVANAPHIPVHLGGMQATVKFQLKHFSPEGFRRGDVILCNHPKAGGSHLPDLTVITPVFCSSGSQLPDFFVANRGHHSDIGGLVPGSMPPHSHCLAQEGAVFVTFKIVEEGVFKEKELIDQLQAPGNYPGCTGTRNLRDNLADLNAQIAANQKGIILLNELVDAYGMEVVQAYMQHIQSNAECAVRRLLIKTAKRRLEGSADKAGQLAELHAEDRMDDGTCIRLRVAITQTGDALFDFSGTGPQVHSSCNTPPAVRMAAVIYCLRCLIGEEIPLNQGCLEPITISVPDGTILSPSDDAAVVGGNVLTSQRLCDVILLAFEAVAASQGCMNNVTFGDERMGGYYETVAGGAGAGPNFHGRHGVHTHMTNTRITDPEIVESRYPVIVRRFCLRLRSGGAGRWRGGDGVSRHLQFRRDGLQLSVLTERRVFAPYGLHGGAGGACGSNILRRARDGVRVNLGSKTSVLIEAGDIFELETPGGGGYGTIEEESAN